MAIEALSIYSAAQQKFTLDFLLAKLLSVRYAPVSERAKACKEAKGNRKQKKPNQKPQTTKPKQKTEHHKHEDPFAAGETCEAEVHLGPCDEVKSDLVEVQAQAQKRAGVWGAPSG